MSQIFNRIYNSKSLSDDLTMIVLGSIASLLLLLKPKPDRFTDAGSDWFLFLSTGLQMFFIIFACLLFSRIRQKAGAAGMFILLYFFLRDEFRSESVISYLTEIYLGPGFLPFMVFVFYKLGEFLIGSSNIDQSNNNHSSKDDLVMLNLNNANDR